MALFSDDKQVYDVIGGFIKDVVAKHDVMGSKVTATNMTIKLKFSDPETFIYIDATGEPEGDSYVNVSFGKDEDAKVTMIMSSDLAHEFWKGKVNLNAEMTRGNVVTEGPLMSVLKLIPALRPAFALYPEYLEKKGFSG